MFGNVKPVPQREPVAAVFKIGDLLRYPFFLAVMSRYFKLMAGAVSLSEEKEGCILLGLLTVTRIDQSLVILTEEIILAVAGNAAKLDVGIDKLAVAGNINTRRRVPEQGRAELFRCLRQYFQDISFFGDHVHQAAPDQPRFPSHSLT